MIPQRTPLLAHHALKKPETKETKPFPKLPNLEEEETEEEQAPVPPHDDADFGGDGSGDDSMAQGQDPMQQLVQQLQHTSQLLTNMQDRVHSLEQERARRTQ